MTEASKGRLRGVKPGAHLNNRFRRLTTLCGLNAKEAAEYLDVSVGTVEQKLLGKRGTTLEDEEKLAALWRKIQKGDLDFSSPPGAIRQFTALQEAIAIRVSMDPDETVAEIDERFAADDEGLPTKPGVPRPMSEFKLKTDT